MGGQAGLGAVGPHASITASVVEWYGRQGRDLPWRRPGTSPWAILVSEVMLQQTPVARVLPAYDAWLRRWPDAAALAASSPSDAIRAWGRLGYPRRARWLYDMARQIVAGHGGMVPSAYDDLRSLPGVGDYTAAAVASFAFGKRHAVLDTNVRRVLARALVGRHAPAARSTSASERALARSVLPVDAALAARWAVASMELGALVCRSRSPECGRCPIVTVCAWYTAGRPEPEPSPQRRRIYEGTDRQARGRLLSIVRDATQPVSVRTLDAAWPDSSQRARALHGLVVDRLVERLPGDRYRLPA